MNRRKFTEVDIQALAYLAESDVDRMVSEPNLMRAIVQIAKYDKWALAEFFTIPANFGVGYSVVAKISVEGREALKAAEGGRPHE